MALLIMSCNPIYWVMAAKEKGFRDWSDKRKMLDYFILLCVESLLCWALF